MRNDDVIQSLRYTLNLSDKKLADIIKLGGYEPTSEEIAHIFDKSEDKDDVSHKLTAHFLDGLIFHRRGKSDKHPPRPIELPVTNNTVLKKLRVAFKLREIDIMKILKSVDFDISSAELNAFFRDEKHRNFRPAGDQVLRYFLKGLTDKYRQ